MYFNIFELLNASYQIVHEDDVGLNFKVSTHAAQMVLMIRVTIISVFYYTVCHHTAMCKVTHYRKPREGSYFNETESVVNRNPILVLF